MYNFYSAEMMSPREKRYYIRCMNKIIEEKREERKKRYERRCDNKMNKCDNSKSHSMILRPRIYYFLSFFGY